MPVPTSQQQLDGLKIAYYQIAQAGVASYSVNGRTWTGEKLADLRAEIKYWEEKVAAEANGGRRIFGVGVNRNAR